MDLKQAQEAWDRCNFTEEQIKLFPRPETEEDLKKLEKAVFEPSWNSIILWLILGLLFNFGFGNPNLDQILKSSENKDNPEQ